MCNRYDTYQFLTNKNKHLCPDVHIIVYIISNFLFYFLNFPHLDIVEYHFNVNCFSFKYFCYFLCGLDFGFMSLEVISFENSESLLAAHSYLI